MVTFEELMTLNLRDFHGNFPSNRRLLEWFTVLEAGWVHDGYPDKPHAKLHSGKHSTGYFLCKRVLQYGNLREILAAVIVHELKKVMSLDTVHGVFGAPNSSTTLAADVGRLIGVPNHEIEKNIGTDGSVVMTFKPDAPIRKGANLLRVEELVTTLDSSNKATAAVINRNPHPVNILPQIGVLVYRPPVICRQQPNGSLIVPAIECQVDAWEPRDCPLCKKGSLAIEPKGANWAQLVS